LQWAMRRTAPAQLPPRPPSCTSIARQVISHSIIDVIAAAGILLLRSKGQKRGWGRRRHWHHGDNYRRRRRWGFGRTDAERALAVSPDGVGRVVLQERELDFGDKVDGGRRCLLPAWSGITA